MSLSGQWVGKYTGTNSGTLVIDIDEMSDHYWGVACAWDANTQLPSSLVRFRTSSKANSHTLPNLPIVPMDLAGNVLTQNQLAALAANRVIFPSTVNADIQLTTTGGLSVKWVTPIGTSGGGSAIGPKTQGGARSVLQPKPIKSWSRFKKFVNGLDRKRYIFRGQENSEWRLRTSFYRTGRANLDRYLTQDVSNDLQKALSALTRFPFNLKDPLQYGAFLNLAQHHGYPTPLLDWTWSPYVAVFFAFRDRRGKPPSRSDRVRIFKFDIFEWNKLPRYDKLFPVQPHVSVLDALAFENVRAIPQQSISTVSNVDDIETYIQTVEETGGRKYLEVIELRSAERQNIMDELALMGITAGSLFPGLDGACEALRERNF